MGVVGPWTSVLETLVGQSVESGPPFTTTAIVGEQPEQMSLATAAAREVNNAR
jgi:hypothetical protein